jgi:plastocyanin
VHIRGFLGITIGAAIASALLVPGASAAVPNQIVRIRSFPDCLNGADFCYEPKIAPVPPGTKVVWKNRDSVDHTVTRCDLANCPVGPGSGADNGPDSPFIGPGGRYVFVFNAPGSYVYYCEFHGYAAMHGKIKVSA